MAGSRKAPTTVRSAGPVRGGTGLAPPSRDAGAGGRRTTGRFILIFRDRPNDAEAKSALANVMGVREVVSSADYANAAISAADMAAAKAVHFAKLGIAVVAADDAAFRSAVAAAADADGAIVAVEPEYIAHATARPVPPTLDYLRGYRDAVGHLYDQFVAASVVPGFEAEAAAAFVGDDQFTWGLRATGVDTSRYSGKGINVAVLDTGLDLRHPDFAGRPIVSQSFVQGQGVQDGHGHGTHCTGTACGPQRPDGTPRYGVAYAAQVFVGKVLDDFGSGATGDIVAGIEWAVANGCQVVSMSLAADIDQQVSQYDVPVRRALAAGTLVVAAAGNNADRASGQFGFVGPPANADAAVAVAAVDSGLQVANFSARSSTATGDGGKVNLAGPGVDVQSAWPMPTRYRTISGTSMATPHVAGIAALWCEATGLSGDALWAKVTQSARPLSAPSADVGMGLVQAPQ